MFRNLKLNRNPRTRDRVKGDNLLAALLLHLFTTTIYELINAISLFDIQISCKTYVKLAVIKTCLSFRLTKNKE